MKTFRVTKKKTFESSVAPLIDLRMMMVLGCFAAASFMTYAADPDWWITHSLKKPGVTANDYAVANQGQLKNMVRGACDELLAKGYITIAHPIYLQVQSWRTNTDNAKDYAPVNLGQLKAAAKPIYKFLHARNSSINYPWSSAITDDKDYAVANIGQLKRVFSFSILGDTDADGIPDDWETGQGMNPSNSVDAGLSLNRDGPTALENYQRWMASSLLGADGDDDNDEVPNFMDADPLNDAVGVMTITISAPTSGATF